MESRVSPCSLSFQRCEGRWTGRDRLARAVDPCGARRLMRILMLSAALPMAWGSDVRAFHFLEYLTRGHAVDLIAFHVWPGSRPPCAVQPALLADMRARCGSVTSVP